jgi:hypothetical protein
MDVISEGIADNLMEKREFARASINDQPCEA